VLTSIPVRPGSVPGKSISRCLYWTRVNALGQQKVGDYN
jgi:hypothetical protein